MKISRRTSRPARIEMLPLIDIVFLLLVFFIYAMLSMAVQRGLQLDLPESSRAQTEQARPLALSLRQGTSGQLEYYLDRQRVSAAELGRLVGKAGNKPEAGRIALFAEEGITYQQLYQVLDLLNKNGCSDISLQASPE